MNYSQLSLNYLQTNYQLTKQIKPLKSNVVVKRVQILKNN